MLTVTETALPKEGSWARSKGCEGQSQRGRRGRKGRIGRSWVFEPLGAFDRENLA